MLSFFHLDLFKKAAEGRNAYRPELAGKEAALWRTP